MNKNEFLNELRNSIQILEDSEQADIINEYSQHIDMKVKEGMSEADAIADFGPIDLLVEEVLGAYHVKAPDKTPAQETNSLIDGGKQMAAAAADATKKSCSKMKGAVTGVVDKAKHKAAETRNRHSKKALVESAPCEGSNSRSRPGAAVLSGVARGTSNLWASCIQAAKTCIRWCWNAFVACAAFATLAGAVCALFCFGFSIVLMLQGYPLIGITLSLFGGTATLTFATLLLMRLVVLKKESGESALWQKPEISSGFSTQAITRTQDSPANMPLPHV